MNAPMASPPLFAAYCRSAGMDFVVPKLRGEREGLN